MATLGVVAFRNASPHSKIHVLQESINNDNVIKADKQEILALKKKQKQAIPVTNLILQSPQPRKKPQKVKETKVNPPPTAVARRNARERNRVKQVNNGFATLRQHIPNEIAEIFENANNNRAANKKLSKVETLRMAVEYIRSLENLLSFNENDAKENPNISLASFPSPASSESLQNGSAFEQGYFSLQSPMLEDEDSDPPTPLPPVSTHHYSRIPGTNAFQLIPGHAPLIYEDEENIHPMTPNSDLIPQEEMLMVSHIPNVDFVQAQDLGVHFYSESSSSPNNEFVDVKYAAQPGQIYYQTIYSQSTTGVPVVLPLDRLKDDKIPVPVDELLHNKIVFDPNSDDEMKQEPDELDGSFQHDIDTDENVDDMINWWEAEGSREDQSQ
ncbi:uncharacterized protein LOC143911832 [Arctopsyche grandis]|uniref:uncharacterized protein LOC143911832 n=1 Tax=Arctopsyche grandis TaxID=121162 RepID=UPI00406D9F72